MIPDIFNPILYLEENKIGKDFVVGDIHGCYDMLMAKLNEISFDFSKDRLIALGDLRVTGGQVLMK